MGSYLSQPVTEKEIEYGENGSLGYAVAAMQGWRVNMEDAHVCDLDVDGRMNVFGVFDGHGGKEVARFVALHIVEELKKTKGFRANNLPAALKEVYLKLDTLIQSEETRDELIELSTVEKTAEERHYEEVVNMDDVPKVLKAAGVSFVQVDACTESPLHGESEEVQVDVESFDDERPVTVGCFPVVISDSSSQADNSSSGVRTDDSSPQHAAEDGNSSDLHNSEAVVSLESRIRTEDITNETNGDLQGGCLSKSQANNDSTKNGSQAAVESPPAPEAMDVRSEDTEAGSAGEAGGVSGSCELDPDMCNTFTEISDKPRSFKLPRFLAHGLTWLMCPFRCLRSSKVIPDEEAVRLPRGNDEIPGHSVVHEEPQTAAFEIPETAANGLSSINEDEAFEHVPPLDPPSDDVTQAGCTAVVAVIEGQKLYIANAGDSRCVLCHAGVAIPLTHDHKPSDPEEYIRITNAGGFVSEDRVNGCLNLSRAIGDLEYKCLPGFTPDQYMVTAIPDVEVRDLQSGDEFVILACDGIWDVLSNQQACNFVRAKLGQKQSLKAIAAELCDYCLSEDTEGSGDGCDNMTAMIIQFKQPAACS